MNDIKKLFLYPSFKCNRKCRFCFISDITKSIYRDSVPLKDLFDSICSGYEKGIRSISFLGGEPTLYEHLQDLISFAKKMNYNRVTIYSNGLIMSDREYVRMLSKFRPIYIVMNIPSCREKDFDFITQTAGGLEKTVRALCNLKEFGIKVKAVCVVNKINFQYLAKYSKFYHSYGIDSFQINYVKYAGNLDSRLISNQKNIASMAVSMTEAMTGIAPMLDECDKMSLELPFIEDMPFCVMGRHYKRQLELYGIYNDNGTSLVIEPDEKKHNRVSTSGKVFLSRCKECRVKSFCYGIDCNYINMFGPDEFVPVISDPGTYYEGLP